MAENMKTYSANVDVNTSDAAKNIDLLNRKVATSIGEFDNLNEAISKTQDTLGKIDPKSKEFKELSQELAGLKDRLRETETQSVRFTEALANQPGVIGLVGQSVEGLRGTLKVFMANPIIAVLTAIAGAFLLLKESLSKTSEGQEVLNRISGAFGKIIGPVMAIIEKVALPIFEKFADLLDLVAKGFNRFARFLGVSQEKIKEASVNSSEVLKKASEDEKKRQEDETKKLEEEQKKRAEARKAAAEKKKQEALKAAEEEKRRQEAAEKILLEAQLSLLSDRDRELKERELRFQEELKALKAAGVTDLTAFEEEYRLDTLEINKKYDDEELKRQEEANKKKQEEQDKANEDAKKKKEEYDKFIVESEQFKAEALQTIQDLQVSNIQQVGGILTSIAGKNKKLAIAGLVIEQGANIAKVVIDTARAISAASAAAAPFIANPITTVVATANLARVIAQQKIAAALSIAGIVAGAAKGISQINQAQIPGSSGGGSAGGGGGVSIPTPPVPSTSAPTIQGGGGADPTSLIRQTISESNRRPIRAFVVSQDMSSQQALDRRTNQAASFG
jgi:chemotaxis protein histidine kinase CheA